MTASCDDTREVPATPVPAKAGSLTLIVAGQMLFAATFDMGGAIGIKYLLIAVAALYVLLVLRALRIPPSEMVIALGLFIAWPLFALLRGLGAGADFSIAVGQVTPFLPGVLFLLLIRDTDDAQRAMELAFNILLALAIVTLTLFAVFAIAPGAGPVRAIATMLDDPRHGYFGIRSIGSITFPNVYFRATLFLVPAYIYFLWTGRGVRALVCAAPALVLAVSKAGVLLCVLASGIYLLTASSWKIRFALVCSAAAIAVTLTAVVDLGVVLQLSDTLLDAITGRAEPPCSVSGTRAPWSICSLPIRRSSGSDRASARNSFPRA